MTIKIAVTRMPATGVKGWGGSLTLKHAAWSARGALHVLASVNNGASPAQMAIRSPKHNDPVREPCPWQLDSSLSPQFRCATCVCGTFDPRLGWFEKGGLALCEHALKFFPENL